MNAKTENYMRAYAHLSDHAIIKYNTRHALPVVFGYGRALNRRMTLAAAVKALATRNEVKVAVVTV